MPDHESISGAARYELQPLFSDSSRTVQSLLHKVALVLVGAVLIAVGIVGWVLPFIPGVPLIIAGIAVIAIAIPSFAKHVNRLEQRLPLSVRLFVRGMRWRDYERRCEVNRFFDS